MINDQAETVYFSRWFLRNIRGYPILPVDTFANTDLSQFGENGAEKGGKRVARIIRNINSISCRDARVCFVKRTSFERDFSSSLHLLRETLEADRG